MRAELLDDLIFDGPVSHVCCSGGSRLLTVSANQLVYKHLSSDSNNINARDEFPGYILNVKTGRSFCAVICSDGLLYLRRYDGQSLISAAAIRIQDYEIEMAALYINDEFIALSSECFVLVLNIEQVWSDLCKTPRRSQESPAVDLSSEVPLQSSWGVMHKLHSSQIRDVTMSSDSRYVISADEDGLICVADRNQMDRLDIGIIGCPSTYNEELCDASINLMVMCININASVQQISLLRDQQVIVLTDTHEIAVYNFDFMNAGDGGETDFEIISAPSRRAFEIGELALVSELTQAGVDVDSGIMDVATIVCAAHTCGVYAVVTHSAGGVGLVKVFEGRQPSIDDDVKCMIIEGLSAEYARCASYVQNGKLIVGTDTGHVYIELEGRAKRAHEEPERSPLKKLKTTI